MPNNRIFEYSIDGLNIRLVFLRFEYSTKKNAASTLNLYFLIVIYVILIFFTFLTFAASASATIWLKTRWSGTLIQGRKRCHELQYCICTLYDRFGKLSKKSWVHFCTLVNVIRCCSTSGSSRTFPISCTLPYVFPIEMSKSWKRPLQFPEINSKLIYEIQNIYR